jgi:hypothetical protein
MPVPRVAEVIFLEGIVVREATFDTHCRSHQLQRKGLTKQQVVATVCPDWGVEGKVRQTWKEV